jgi:hypothetical protein
VISREGDVVDLEGVLCVLVESAESPLNCSYRGTGNLIPVPHPSHAQSLLTKDVYQYTGFSRLQKHGMAKKFQNTSY